MYLLHSIEQIRAIQHVDVTMFSNGKFKNTIAVSEESDGLPLTSGNTLDRQYSLALMENGGGRHWVALEDRYGRYTRTNISLFHRANQPSKELDGQTKVQARFGPFAGSISSACCVYRSDSAISFDWQIVSLLFSRDKYRKFFEN